MKEGEAEGLTGMWLPPSIFTRRGEATSCLQIPPHKGTSRETLPLEPHTHGIRKVRHVLFKYGAVIPSVPS